MISPEPAAARDDAHVMQCMEVWGGNRVVDTAVSTQGIDAWLYSRPYAGAGASETPDAGGDIHYLTSCATGRITRMLLADVSGHGEAVAKAARAIKQLLGDYANYVDQTRFVSAVNQRFGDLGEATRGLFATAVVATFFAPTDELAVCCAGHPPPLHYVGASRSWRLIEPEDRSDGPCNLPLGVHDEGEYRQRRLVLAPGDLAVLYTDALPEARAPGGEMLGFDGLVRIAGEVGADDGETFIPRLLARIDGHRAPPGAHPPPSEDDVTVLVIRRNGERPRSSLLLGAKSAARVGRRALTTLLRERRLPPLPEMTLQNLLGPFLDRFNHR